MNYPRAAVLWIDDNCLPNLARNSKRTCSMRWRCKWRTEKGGMRVIHKVTNSNNIEWGMSVMWPTLVYWFWNEARSAGPCYCMIIKVLSEDRNGSFSWSHETYFRILGCFKPKEDKLKKVKVLLQKKKKFFRSWVHMKSLIFSSKWGTMTYISLPLQWSCIWLFNGLACLESCAAIPLFFSSCNSGFRHPS